MRVQIIRRIELEKNSWKIPSSCKRSPRTSILGPVPLSINSASKIRFQRSSVSGEKTSPSRHIPSLRRIEKYSDSLQIITQLPQFKLFCEKMVSGEVD